MEHLVVDLTSEDPGPPCDHPSTDIITLDDSIAAEPKNEPPITIGSDSEEDMEVISSRQPRVFMRCGPMRRSRTRPPPTTICSRPHPPRINHTISNTVIANNGCVNEILLAQRPHNRPAELSSILPKPAPSPEPQQRSRFTQPPPESPPDALKCPICIETYVNVKKRGLKVVVTRCGHIFCDFCLKKAISGNGRKCPKCRKAIPKGPTGIIEIFDVC